MKKLIKIKNSLSAKLLGLFVLMSFLLLVIAGSNIAFSFKNNFEENIRPHLIQYLEYVQADIGSPPNIEKAKSLTESLPIEVTIKSHNKSWSSTNEVIRVSDIHYYRMFDKNNLKYKMGWYKNREYLVIQQPNQTLFFSIPHPHEHFHIKHTIPLIITILLLALFYYLTRRVFLPIKTIEKGINRIGSGDLSHRINIKRSDELGSLADNINNMAAQINDMLNAKRQLLLSISHEIRSPVTRAKVATEMLSNEEYKKEISNNLNEIESLTEELLETERLSANHQVLNKQEIKFDELIESVVGQYFPKQHFDKNIQHVKEAFLDASRIKLLIKNLIGNAVAYCSAQDNVVLTLTQEKGNIVFSVHNHGSFIAEEHLPHLTEPFYRVDPSRQRETGGYGLGLYLCRIITEAHGGKIEITSQIDKGTTVLVNFPV